MLMERIMEILVAVVIFVFASVGGGEGE